MKAIIKGETHISEKDKQVLMQIDLSGFDAVFREGYDNDYFKREFSILYSLFALGHFVYQASIGRLYISLDEFKNRVENHGLNYYDEIDAGIYETYDMTSLKKRVILAILSPFFAAFIFGLFTIPLRWIIAETAPSFLLIFNIVLAFVIILLFGFVWAVSFFTLTINEVMQERDERMAKTIIDISEKEGYQEILISCGGAHSSGISTYLEENGWETEIRTTQSPLGKILLWMEHSVETLLHPIRALGTVYSRIRASV